MGPTLELQKTHNLDAPDVFKTVLNRRGDATNHHKHAPVPTILRPVAGITFEMSKIVNLYVIYVPIVNKILAHVIWKSFSFNFIQIKNRPNISGIQVVE